MAICDVVNKILGGMKDLGGRVKNYFGKTIFPEKQRLLCTLFAAAILCTNVTNRLKAEVINVYPGDGVENIQAKIETANPGDTVIFNTGLYFLNYLQQYNLKPGIEGSNITYILDNVTISGSGLEHDGIFFMARGGHINLDGKGTSILRRALVPIAIGVVPFKDINIRGINFTDVYDNSIAYENRSHSLPLGKPAFNVSHCTIEGGDKLIMFSEGFGATETSPYPHVENCTISNLNVWGVDLPTYYISDGQGGWIKIVLGQDDINSNVWINCEALVDPHLHEYFSSPKQNAYKDVNEPYIGDPNLGNIIVDANDFLADGFTPKRDSPMNLGGGRFIGSIEPYHDLDGNLDFDEDVDFIDFAISANRFAGTYQEIADVTKDWLMIEPTDPNGNPK